MRVHGCSIWLLPLVLVAAPVTAETGKVVGSVSMSDGRPAPGASVNVGCSGGVAVTRFTDASGSFVVEDLPLGTCQMTVVTTSFQVVVRTVTVDGDIPADVTVCDRKLGLDRPGRQKPEYLMQAQPASR
jgi:hypothetical protein